MWRQQWVELPGAGLAKSGFAAEYWPAKPDESSLVSKSGGRLMVICTAYSPIDAFGQVAAQLQLKKHGSAIL